MRNSRLAELLYSFLHLSKGHQTSDSLLLIFQTFCVSAELKEAVRTWPHTDPVSWEQRTSAVALVRRLDQSFNKAVTALQQNDPKYYRGGIYRLKSPIKMISDCRTKLSVK